MRGQLAMFDPVHPPPLGRPTGTQHHRGTATYTRITVKDPPQCDECVLWLHEHKGVGPLPRRARFRRASAAGTLRLCNQHTTAWKQDD